MAFREVRVFEVREVLRLWLAGEGFRAIERLVGVDRKTVRRYVKAAEMLGLVGERGDEQLTDGFIAMVVEAVRPRRTNGHGDAWRVLEAHHDQIAGWVAADLTGVKIHELLGRRGVIVPCRTVQRYVLEVCGRSRGPGPDGAGRGWRTRRRVADRLRPHGRTVRSGERPEPCGARIDLHRVLFAALFRVVDVPPDHRRSDRGRANRRGGSLGACSAP